VAHALELNYDDPSHPARNFFYNTYHDHFPKHCMICNADNHSTLYCPHDNMRFELSCRYRLPFRPENRKGFVPPGRWSSDKGCTWKWNEQGRKISVFPLWCSASTSEVSDESLDIDENIGSDGKDQGWSPESVRNNTANPPSPEPTPCVSPEPYEWSTNHFPGSTDLAGSCRGKNCYHRTVNEPLVPMIVCQLCDESRHCAWNCTYTLAESSYRSIVRLGSVPEALPVPCTQTETPLPTPILTVKPVKPIKLSLDKIDCHQCGNLGHFARDCPNSKPVKVNRFVLVPCVNR
jgi:hypothetical protein